jgi:hypothetical protein
MLPMTTPPSNSLHPSGGKKRRRPLRLRPSPTPIPAVDCETLIDPGLENVWLHSLSPTLTHDCLPALKQLFLGRSNGASAMLFDLSNLQLPRLEGLHLNDGVSVWDRVKNRVWVWIRDRVWVKNRVWVWVKG